MRSSPIGKARAGFGKGRLSFAWPGAGLGWAWFQLGQGSLVWLRGAGAGRAAWQGSLFLACFDLGRAAWLGLVSAGAGLVSAGLGQGRLGLAWAGVKNKLLVDGIRERILTAIKFTSGKGLAWFKQGQVKGWLGLAGAGRARVGSLGFGLGR
ncbi:hypothetical protein BY996DRAFT_8499537 [Phakopsora pachyrhizi]|nr:hypothetical protein BY996DRAFT_8499537 [Phakopsora pachyrhizi]